MNSALNASAISRAIVVLPEPGGPHRIIECGLPAANATASGLPGASRCRWPMTSSSASVAAARRAALRDGQARRGRPRCHPMPAAGIALTGRKGAAYIGSAFRLSGISAPSMRPASPIRDNPVKATLAAGGTRVRRDGVRILLPRDCRRSAATPAPNSCCYDMEHTGLSFESLKLQCALCRGLRRRADGARAARRVPLHRPGARRRRAGRDGADGRHPPRRPRTSSPARAIRRTGRRGAAFGFAHDDYQGGDVAAKIAALHARTLVIAQIETAEGLNNVEAIAAMPGVDALWLGHFDLTNFMGIPGSSGTRTTWPRSSASLRRARARQGGRVPRHRRRLGARVRGAMASG